MSKVKTEEISLNIHPRNLTKIQILIGPSARNSFRLNELQEVKLSNSGASFHTNFGLNYQINIPVTP